ncbi:MAG: DNRLRE domain-containing protein [Methanococcoides sp.]|nr:DNRLRE domain-containing protein [Methanococcoides sp.]
MKKLNFLLILSFILLLTIPTVLGSNAPIVYVATDGSGDYNSDGTADEVQINQAMDFVASHSEYTTVHLKSGTYIISDTIFIHSNTILEGEPGAVVKLKDECGWPKFKGLIEPSVQDAHDFILRDFAVDGNLFKQSYVKTVMGEPSVHGRSFHDLFRADSNSVSGDHSDPYDFEIYNMHFYDGANDGIRIRGDRSADNIKIHDNTFTRTGHDDIYIMSAEGVQIYDNDFTWIYGDCGVRIENTDDVVITRNTLYTNPSEPQGISGIYLSLTDGSYTSQNYEISYNTIKQVREMGIVVCNRVTGTPSLDKAKDLYIHHNLIYDAIGNRGYGGGIQINGWHNTVIENNVIDGVNGDGIVTRNRFGMGSTTGYKIYVRNNIITNTDYYSGLSSSGHAINNYLDSRHDFILENNNVWNNEKGNYRNVGSAVSDLNVNPLFVDQANNDYRLRSNSPIIDAGMGVYGSDDSTPAPSNTAPVLNAIGDRTVDEGSTLSSTVSATDANGDSLAYSATGLPSGASIGSSTGAFSWTPSEGQEGTHSVTFEVTDGQLTDSEEVTITVIKNTATAPSLVYDNRLRESTPDTTLAEDNYIDIGNFDGTGRYRDVMWFNLSTYNTTDAVSDATLSLYWYYPDNSPRNQDTVVEIYRAGDWNPDDVSWNNKAAGTPWNNAGGDWFDVNNVAQGSEPYASITFDANDLPDDRYYEFDITELVQNYVSGEYDNTGFFLKAQDEHDNYIAFYSSDWSNEDQRPKLTIDHLTESDSVIGPENPSITPVHLSASSDQIAPGETFTVDVLIDPAVPITGAQLDLLFDGSKLTAGSVAEGNLFDQNGASTFFSSGIMLNNNGKIEEVYSSIIGQESVTSQGVMATISMTAGSATGIAEIDLANVVISDTNSNLMPFTTSKATVLVDTAPVIDQIGAKYVDETSTLTFAVSATDADGDILTYSAADLPAGASFDSASGEFTWTPAEGQAGIYVVTSEATDGYLADSESFTINVNAAYPRADVNEDGIVNILDITLVGQDIGISAESNPCCDVNQDGLINILDLTLVAQNFGDTVN